MAHWVKCLLHRHEDLSSDSQHPYISWAQLWASITIDIGELGSGQRQVDLGAFLSASLSKRVSKLQCIPISKSKMKKHRGRQPTFDSSFCGCTPGCAHLHTYHMHTHTHTIQTEILVAESWNTVLVFSSWAKRTSKSSFIEHDWELLKLPYNIYQIIAKWKTCYTSLWHNPVEQQQLESQIH